RQVLAGNISNPELVRQEQVQATPAAYCTAKGRIPPEVIQEISQRACDAAERAFDQKPEHLWKGHRTWHVDGSSCSMPDTPELQGHFGQSGNQKPGCGFPVAHLLCLFSAITGLIRDVIISPMRSSDAAVAPQVRDKLKSGDIVIGDTIFSGYFHMALLWLEGVLMVFPNHQKRIVNFRPHRRFS